VRTRKIRYSSLGCGVSYEFYEWSISQYLAYGRCARSASGSQNLAASLKRHDSMSVSFAANKNKENTASLFPLLIVELKIPG